MRRCTGRGAMVAVATVAVAAVAVVAVMAFALALSWPAGPRHGRGLGGIPAAPVIRRPMTARWRWRSVALFRPHTPPPPSHPMSCTSTPPTLTHSRHPTPQPPFDPPFTPPPRASMKQQIPPPPLLAPSPPPPSPALPSPPSPRPPPRVGRPRRASPSRGFIVKGRAAAGRIRASPPRSFPLGGARCAWRLARGGWVSCCRRPRVKPPGHGAPATRQSGRTA